MPNVKIYGAGSIGNHLSHAARSLGWTVTVCDVSQEALDRMRSDIYPGRYGRWDNAISLYRNQDAPRGDFDLILVGTPPEHHIPIAQEALEELPKGILIEKPLCPPTLEGADALARAWKASDVSIYVGYEYAVGRAARKVEQYLEENAIGTVETIDVEYREHWGGIFAAHPWLDGPEDSYLGYSDRGGGASGEHSHAVNLWQHFAHVVGAGRVQRVGASMKYVEEGRARYDKLCFLNLVTESGLHGRVVQDLVTFPANKRVALQGRDGRLEWVWGAEPGVETVTLIRKSEDPETVRIEKIRPYDFIEELQAIQSHLSGQVDSIGITLGRGLDSILVIAAAHQAARARRDMIIDFDRGYSPDAVRPSPSEGLSGRICEC